MTDDCAQPDLGQQLASITLELRRHGRAVLGAQAAAESCLDELRALTDIVRSTARVTADHALRSHQPATEAVGANSDSPHLPGAVTWLNALLPTCDALVRAAAQAQSTARRLQSSLGPQRPGPLENVLAEVALLAHGLELLDAQLLASLEKLGVRIDRELGCPVDPQRHRVVELASQITDPPRVEEVVRRGFWLGQHCLRETEVRATRQQAAEREE